MPLNEHEYRQVMADPKRSASASQAADTRSQRARRRHKFIVDFMLREGRFPTEQEAIEGLRR